MDKLYNQEPTKKRKKLNFMTLTDIFSKNSILKRYYFKTLFVIGILWTCFDYSRFLMMVFKILAKA